MDELGERSQNALPAAPEQKPSGHSRRQFLKRAAGVAIGLPAAGALVGNAAAVPRVSVSSRALLNWGSAAMLGRNGIRTASGVRHTARAWTRNPGRAP